VVLFEFGYAIGNAGTNMGMKPIPQLTPKHEEADHDRSEGVNFDKIDTDTNSKQHDCDYWDDREMR
jgi:hypothetical protein